MLKNTTTSDRGQWINLSHHYCILWWCRSIFDLVFLNQVPFHPRALFVVAPNTRAPFQYPIRRLILWSREVSNLRDLYLELPDRSEIWQTHRQYCCRSACEILNRCEYSMRLRDFTRSYDKTSYRILRWDPDLCPSIASFIVYMLGTFLYAYSLIESLLDAFDMVCTLKHRY